MIALDLFCGAGGAAEGLHRAGFEVWGVDIEPQPSYPFEFIQEDAVDFMEQGLDDFDFIWASPPCQAYSWSTKFARNQGKVYTDLIDITRDFLVASGKPYIIENVVGAPLKDPVLLCGTMFPNLKVFRHRVFESNCELKVNMSCAHGGNKAKERRNDDGNFFTVAGHAVGTKEEWGEAMGIEWMQSKAELSQSIPPAYSEFLAKQVIKNEKLCSNIPR